MKFFKRKRNIIITVVVILILLFILCGKKKSTTVVEVSPAKYEDINETVSIDGTLEPFVDVAISSDITGKAVKIYVKEGDFVKKDAPLLKISDVSQKARLNEAKTAFDAAKSNYDYIAYKFKNQKELFESGLTSKSEYTQAELEFKNAENTLASMQASYEIAADNISKTMITSPIDGMITAIYVEEGENIITGTMNNEGTVLMTVSDNNRMIVKTDVDETSIVKIMKGNPTTVIFDAFPDTTYTGKVYQKGNRPTQTSSASNTGVEYEIKILLEGLYPTLVSGMTGEVTIITQTKDSVLTIPIQSVVSRNGEEGVFVLHGKKISFIPVKTGISSNMKLELLSDSIKEGDNIVTGPFMSIKILKDKETVKLSDKKTKMNPKKETKTSGGDTEQHQAPHDGR